MDGARGDRRVGSNPEGCPRHRSGLRVFPPRHHRLEWGFLRPRTLQGLRTAPLPERSYFLGPSGLQDTFGPARMGIAWRPMWVIALRWRGARVVQWLGIWPSTSGPPTH